MALTLQPLEEHLQLHCPHLNASLPQCLLTSILNSSLVESLPEWLRGKVILSQGPLYPKSDLKAYQSHQTPHKLP